MNNSLMLKNINFQPYSPLLDISPYCPNIGYTNVVSANGPCTVSTNFLDIDFSNKTYASTARPVRALTSDSTNLFYLGHNTTVGNNYGCRIQTDSAITLNYAKTTPMKPAACYIRTPVGATSQFCNGIIIIGINSANQTQTPLGMLVDITQAMLQSGVWIDFSEIENLDYYDQLQFSFHKPVSGSSSRTDGTAAPEIGSFKLYGYPKVWNQEICNKYNEHILSIYDYASTHDKASAGRMS